jgi:putative flavoprotein involved in K+ transport
MPGKDPGTFSCREEVIQYFEDYIRRNRLPVRYSTFVLAVHFRDDLYVVETTAGAFTARNVVIATGLYQRPRVPEFKGGLSPEIVQLHSDSYWKPSYLPL